MRGRMVTRISLKRKKKAPYTGRASVCRAGVAGPAGLPMLKMLPGKGMTERLMGMEMALLTGGETMTAAFEEDEPWALEDQDSTQAGQEPEDTAEPASVTAANAEVALGAKVTTLMPPEGIQPRIILYSTHSNESFRKVEGDNYEESANGVRWTAAITFKRLHRIWPTFCNEYHLPVMFDSTDHELGNIIPLPTIVRWRQ